MWSSPFAVFLQIVGDGDLQPDTPTPALPIEWSVRAPSLHLAYSSVLQRHALLELALNRAARQWAAADCKQSEGIEAIGPPKERYCKIQASNLVKLGGKIDFLGRIAELFQYAEGYCQKRPIEDAEGRDEQADDLTVS